MKKVDYNDQKIQYGMVDGGEGAFIGTGTTILSGIKIGKWSIIGANSTVTKSVKPFQTVVGSPAKQI